METKVLFKGMNFALTPRKIPVKDIIQSTEPALKHLDKTAANQVRIQVLQTLKNAKLPRPNTSKQANAAIQALHRDKSIHSMSADKGNATVVMSTTDYDHKVTAILSTDTYGGLSRNPIPAIERKITNQLRSQAINTPTYRHLKPSASSCPRFFGQPKIHKPDVPLRPIVASRGSPRYNTARHLTKILHPLVGRTPHHITNSNHDQFVDIIKDLKLKLCLFTHPASNQLSCITGQTQPESFPPKCSSLQPYLASASSAVQHSPEDEQSILFEASIPQRLFSQPPHLTWKIVWEILWKLYGNIIQKNSRNENLNKSFQTEKLRHSFSKPYKMLL